MPRREHATTRHQRCLDRLHKHRTLKLLKIAKDGMGQESWSSLRKHFASVRNCGFSDAEIDAAGYVPLFIRLMPGMCTASSPIA